MTARPTADAERTDNRRVGFCNTCGERRRVRPHPTWRQIDLGRWWVCALCEEGNR